MDLHRHLSPVERGVMELPPGVSIPLTPAQVDALLVDPGYRPSLGHPPHAQHFRRALPDGGGLHLVLTDAGAELHRDIHDPHAGPAPFLLHLSTDAPGQTLSLLAAGWAVVRRLGGGGRRFSPHAPPRSRP